MAIPSHAGGMIALYGVAIGNALHNLTHGNATIEDLVSLRDQAKTVVDSQGDLASALRAVEAEIAKRGVKAAPEPAGERFVAQIDGVSLPEGVKQEIEAAIEKAVMAEIAKIDTKGDMVASPLSKIAAFGTGFGAHTPGRAIVSKQLT